MKKAMSSAIPVAAYTIKSSQVGDTSHQLPRTSDASLASSLSGGALRLRMGLPLKERMQGNRKCRYKVRGANMGEARWDPHGTHLAAGCAWEGWRTKRHDDIATMMVEWINVAGGRAHE